VDCLHEPEEYGLTLRGRMIAACSACAWHESQGFKLRDTAELTAALHDVMGDDVDGVAAMLDDVRYMGGV
jgi:hypothetical protein